MRLSELDFTPNFVPFADLTDIHDGLLRTLAYHTQTAAEFYLLLTTLPTLPEKWVSINFIEEFFKVACLNMRKVEFTIVDLHLSCDKITFEEEREPLYQTYFLLHALRCQITKGKDRAEGRGVDHVPLIKAQVAFIVENFPTSSEERVLHLLAIAVKNLNKVLKIKYA